MGYLGDRFGQRLLFSSVGIISAMTGMIMIIALPLDNKIGRLLGYYMLQASACPFVALLSLISSNIAGYTKKTSFAALYLIAYCVGNIIGIASSSPGGVNRN
jgi:ACS family allantoate permease-like MFS transporter